MKKLVSIVASLALVMLTIAGCGSKQAASTDTAVEQKAETSANYKISVITMDSVDQHWVNLFKGAEKAASELGCEVKFMSPQQKDDAQQIEQINNAVSGGYNAILIAANGPDAITSALKEAVSNGVKIVYVDSPANFTAEATFSTNNTAAGKTAGETLISALKDKGVTSGKIGIVGVNQSTQSTKDREAGFREAFKGTDFELLETQFSDGDASKGQNIAENYITQGCVGIFGTNEGSTTGTGNAIKASGGDVLAVGFDKSDAILGLLKDGFLVATMAQNPDVMGYEGVKAAVEVLNGGSLGGKVVDTGVTVVKE